MSDENPDYAPAGEVQQWRQSSPPVPSQNVQATMAQMTDQLQTVIDAAERAAGAIRHDAEEQARHHLQEAQRKADSLTAERVGLISDLTDDLVRHAGTVREHSELMIQALEDAISSVTDKLEQPALSQTFPPALDSPSAEQQSIYESLPVLEADAELQELPADESTDLSEVEATPTSEPEPEPSEPVADLSEVEATPTSEPEPEPSEPVTDLSEVEAAPTSEPAAEAASELPEDALMHATRLAVAGTDREAIAAALRDEYGLDDPDPVVARVLGES